MYIESYRWVGEHTSTKRNEKIRNMDLDLKVYDQVQEKAWKSQTTCLKENLKFYMHSFKVC